MVANILGPDPARGAVTARPAKTTGAAAARHWFGNCSNPNDPNQTKITADCLNDVLGVLRGAVDAAGAAESETAALSDVMLAEAAARIASLGIFGTGGGTANAQTVTKIGNAVPPKAYFDGMEVSWIPSAVNTGAATLTPFGLATKDLVDLNGSPLVGGEIAESASARYHAATDKFRLQTGMFIRADTTLTVGPAQQYATIQAALDALKYKLIAPGVVVTLQLTAGQHTITSSVSLNHLNSSSIVIKGAAMIGAFPVRADIVASAATTLTTLRGKWATEIICSNCNGFNAPRARLLKLENLLITGSGGYAGVVVGNTPTAPLNNPMLSGDFYGSGQLTALNCWVHNMGTGWWGCQHANLNVSKCGASHTSKAGFAVENGSVMAAQWIMACRNSAGSGLLINSASYAEVYGFVVADNAGLGVWGTYGGKAYLSGDGTGWKEIVANTGDCVSADRRSFVEVKDSTITSGGGNACGTNNGGYILALAASNTITGTFSPAVNTVGNANSYIRN